MTATTASRRPAVRVVKHLLAIAANGCLVVGDTGLEPVTPSLSSDRNRVLSGEAKDVTAAPSPACTAACTRKPEIAHETTGEGAVEQAATDAEPAAGEGADTLAMLAAALVNLSAADRAKLAAMLLQGQPNRVDKGIRDTD